MLVVLVMMAGKVIDVEVRVADNCSKECAPSSNSYPSRCSTESEVVKERSARIIPCGAHITEQVREDPRYWIRSGKYQQAIMQV